METKMKTYLITIPARTLEINATNKEEAIELFWFEYDNDEFGNERQLVVREK